jgi:hypothetical protein
MEVVNCNSLSTHLEGYGDPLTAEYSYLSEDQQQRFWERPKIKQQASLTHI